MPTPPDPERPQRGPVLEPVRVLRPRRLDGLAELMREMDSLAARPADTDEAETQELPPVAAPSRTTAVLRRTAVAGFVAAAALLGFGCALLLTGRQQAAATAPPHRPATTAPPATAPAPPPTPTAATDPDGPGTLRQGDTGPEVAELQQRLLRVPDVYRDGSTSGTYDAGLTAAVARFQLWYGISGDETGVYGNDTRRALESRTSLGDDS
ncbi:peptidoglycan-binding domain-containing protein [Streptomyces sp. NPDC004546]|uniref:peptidoglycan-binding domain-containing protein n=1 Tax=unclassified Streptomyces TaxID=2593676 RepID=UPI0033A27BE2